MGKRIKKSLTFAFEQGNAVEGGKENLKRPSSRKNKEFFYLTWKEEN
jgi:hypothetical protein